MGQLYTKQSYNFGMSNQQSSESVLSPRSLFRFLASSIQQFTNVKPSTEQEKSLQSTEQFSRYLSTVSDTLAHYQTHKQNRHRQKLTELKQTPAITTQILQLQYSGVIPSEYFDPDMEFKLCKKGQILQTQDELTDYLDEIQMCIFQKLGKYPGKSFDMITNIHEGYQQVEIILNKIVCLRKQLKTKIQSIVQKKRSVKRMHSKSEKIKLVLNQLEFMKKVKTLKELPHQKIDKINRQHYQFMQRIKPSDLSQANSLLSLTRVSSELEEYRESIKNRISQEFEQQLNSILKKLLCYKKEEWLNSQVPNNAFTVQIQDGDNLNCSVMNISVLDQSLFEIHSQSNLQQVQIVQLAKYCEIIDIYNIWDDIEVNQIVVRNLLKVNVKFNRDLDDYITYILDSKGIKVKKNNSKMDYIQMRFYFKLVKVYFDLIKSLLIFIRQNKQTLPFLLTSIPKIHDFIMARMQHFLDLKPIHQKTTKDDLYHYLSMIQYWISEDQLYDQLRIMKQNLVQQHLVSLHTTILVTQLRAAINKSSFLPINIPSQYFVTLEFILSWSRSPEEAARSEALQMSMSICEGQIPVNYQPSHTFKVINNVLILQGKSYKVCQTFLLLLKYLEHYLQLHAMLNELRNNIEEKIFQLIGSYVWYSKKVLIPEGNQGQKKSVKNVCLFSSMVQLLKYLACGFEVQNPKKIKLVQDLQKCHQLVKKQISIVPYLLLEQQVEIIFESRISQRNTIPTPQTVKIIQILNSAIGILKQFFSQRKCISLLTPSVKMLYKNYFGYLVNRQKRGKQELKWFVPKFKQILNEWFPEDVSSMEKQLKERR